MCLPILKYLFLLYCFWVFKVLNYNVVKSSNLHSLSFEFIIIVSGAVRRNKLLNKPSNSVIENEVKVWLRQSCDSSGGRRKRELAKIAMEKKSCVDQSPDNRSSMDDVESDD
jgi:hypothetical protein